MNLEQFLIQIFNFKLWERLATHQMVLKQLEELGATEVIVAFRNAYEGGADNRTLEGMIAEINWYAEEVSYK